MLLAIDPSGVRRAPSSTGDRATCPGCALPVLAKCGDLVSHHWAHESGADCDSWSEGESDWHRAWKERFPESAREVVIGPHRADIALNGRVLELQHSAISTETIAEREAFYGPGMLWLFDAREWRIGYRSDGTLLYHFFRPRVVWSITRPLLLDGLWPGRCFSVLRAFTDYDTQLDRDIQALAGVWVEHASLVSFLSGSAPSLPAIYPLPVHKIGTDFSVDSYDDFPFPDENEPVKHGLCMALNNYARFFGEV